MSALFRIATIQGRLLAGFGTSITLLVAAGVLGWYGLSRSNQQAEATVHDITDRSEFVERATNIALRELVAGMRFLSTGAPADEVQYQNLTVQAEQLRRDAVSVEIGPLKIPVASIDHLIAMKTGTGRNKDKVDIEELQKLKSGGDS